MLPGGTGRFEAELDEHHWLAHWMVGETMCHVAVDDSGERVALVCFASPALSCGPCDRFIGWSSERGKTVYVVLNAYPYASGHLLVMPLRHLGDLGDLTDEESAELWAATRTAAAALTAAYGLDGLNLGANLGRAAGAGIPAHLHLHVLPRWGGDTNFMTSVGGVRVMPEALPQSWRRVTAAWPAG